MERSVHPAEDVAKKACDLGQAVPLHSCLVLENQKVAVIAVATGEHPLVTINACICVEDTNGWVVMEVVELPGECEVETMGCKYVDLLPLEPGSNEVETNTGFNKYSILEVPNLWYFVNISSEVADKGGETFPSPLRVRVNDEWFPIALPGSCVRSDFVAESYIRFQASHDDAYIWASILLEDALVKDPGGVWEVTRAAIELSSDDRTLAAIAAGPLENLLRRGGALSEAIRSTAKSSEKIKRAIDLAWP